LAASQRDVIANRIFLQGWSNGGSTALNAMQQQGAETSGFRAALALYPGCGPKALLAPALATTAPVALLLGSDDEEVSSARCQAMAQRSIGAGSKVDVVLCPGATHGFDDRGRSHQSIPGNRSALADALKRALAFVERLRD
jgi:dienelactone hydrolase